MKTPKKTERMLPRALESKLKKTKKCLRILSTILPNSASKESKD